MKLLSLNTGRPRETVWNGKVVNTSIFKSPVDGPLRISSGHVEGNEQADLRVHGGPDKAVYAYDRSYYDFWKTQFERSDWPWGLFGENLTTEGLPDEEARIGDVYRIGSAHLRVVQPRFPCQKLNVRFGREDMIERMLASGRHGIYFRVEEEGIVQAGDAIELAERSPWDVTVRDVTACFVSKPRDPALLERILAVPWVPDDLKRNFTK